jgi:hypothetical protein
MADSDEVKTTQSWATAATIISAITLAIILFGGIIYLGSVKGWFNFSTWSWPKFGEWGILKSLSAGGVSLGTIMAAVVLFIPDTAVLGGFIADAVNAQFRYSIPSITGLLAAILNYLSTFLFGRDATETQYILGNPRGSPSAAGVVAQAANAVANVAAGAAGAAQQVASIIGVGSAPAAAPAAVDPVLPSARSVVGASPPASVVPRPPANAAGASGLSVAPSDLSLGGGKRRKQAGGARFDGNPSAILGIPLGSKAQPAGLVVLVTILVIYTMDAVYGKRQGTAMILQIIIGAVTVGAYIFAYYSTEVFGKVTNGQITGWWRMSIPIIIGMACGMTGFYVMKTNYPGYLPLDPEGSVTASGEYSRCAAGTGGVGPNGGDLVCDAYLNGERIGTVSA